jgi:hypothetical protein
MNFVMICFLPLNPLKGRIVSEPCREKLTAITPLRGQGVSRFVQPFIPLI